MARATWNGAVLAESDRYEVVEGNVYFPPQALDRAHVRPSDTHTECGWKGTASYCDVVVDGKVNKDAVWYYPDPKPAAANIKGYFAFWKGVTVEYPHDGAASGPPAQAGSQASPGTRTPVES